MSTALAEVEPPIGAARNWTDELKKLRGDYRLFSTNRCAVCGGPLFEDHEDEATDKDKKKKSKKDKKSEKKKSKKKNEDDEDEEDDEDREKTPKKKKGVLRFLHRGKDKAGGVLDGLQYEGDELQRKKAKRQRKREEREGRTSSSSLSSSSSSSSTKSGLERVVSESRLSADRRGRAQPSRSKSMRGDLSSARVICRPCERGEKRRSWGTLCEDALERAGPTWRLYEELSDERDLIASLLTRMDYLVGSVSDAGDLLIELFTPQLRADTEREQQLSDAKAAADGGANDNDGEDDDEGPREGTHMKKKKSMRKSNGGASATTTTTTAATQPSGRPKSGDSKGLALGLARIFGWTTTSSAEGEGKSKVSEDKKQRKVMALLPSCYCPIPKEDKYESYFPAFHLEVYRAAEELQKELTLTADTYKAALKLFARLKATTQTDRQERVVSNMKIAFVEFIQESQPDINWLRVKLQSMFVCQASYVFLVLCQLLWEIRKRQSLWMKLAKPCLATIQVMQGELSSLVVAFHRDWDQHRQRIEEIITEYNKLKAEKAINGGNNGGKASTPRLKGGAEAAADESAKLDDETLLLNCERIVRECVKQVEFNLGEIGLRATKDALIELVANLVLERAKCHL